MFGPMRDVVLKDDSTNIGSDLEMSPSGKMRPHRSWVDECFKSPLFGLGEDIKKREK